MLFRSGFEAQPDTKARGIQTIYYNPSFTPGTQIGRDAALPMKILVNVIVPVVKLFAPINTPELAGQALADLASGRVAPPAGHHYASLVKKKLTWPSISALAADNGARDAAWTDSEKLLASVGG